MEPKDSLHAPVPVYLQGRVVLRCTGTAVQVEGLKRGLLQGIQVDTVELVNPNIMNAPPIVGTYQGDLKFPRLNNAEIEIIGEHRSQNYLEDLANVTITGISVKPLSVNGALQQVVVLGIIYATLVPEVATPQAGGIPPPVPPLQGAVPPPPPPQMPHVPHQPAKKYGSMMDDLWGAVLVFVIVPVILLAFSNGDFGAFLGGGIMFLAFLGIIIGAVLQRKKKINRPKVGFGRWLFRTLFFLVALVIAIVVYDSGHQLFGFVLGGGACVLVFLLFLRWISPLVRAIANGAVGLMLLVSGIGGTTSHATTEWDEMLSEEDLYDEYTFTEGEEQTVQWEENGVLQERDLIVHNREWTDFDGHTYHTGIALSADDARNATNYREDLGYEVSTNKQWTRLYHDLYEQDKNALRFVYDSLEAIYRENNLNQKEFAEVVVTFVQQIPYVLIYPSPCISAPREYRGEPCQGKIKYGVKTPTEFLYDLKGDCDTRTLLIFTILEHFEYDVVILGSITYEHSMIGISMRGIPGGKFKKHQGVKYFTWETTYPGWEVGDISPDMGNMKNWVVDLSTAN